MTHRPSHDDQRKPRLTLIPEVIPLSEIVLTLFFRPANLRGITVCRAFFDVPTAEQSHAENRIS
jgi:hypothetical protein